MQIPSPFVHWAQTKSVVSFKIELKNVENPVVRVTENNVKFSAVGIGARGESLYEFSLDLYDSVVSDDGEPIHVRVFDNRVELFLTKTIQKWWPRVTATPQKRAWLKINFDLWQSDEGFDSEAEETRDVMQDYPGLYDRLHREELGYRAEELQKVYLKIYNFFQFLGYSYVMMVLGIRLMRDRGDSITEAFANVGGVMKFLQLLQYLEVMHPLFGYTKGSVLIPFLQVSGRAFVLFAMIDGEPRMQTKPVVFYLFVIWSTIEVVRYPFYITQLYKKEIFLITWLRYTMWIPLYPLGVTCEAIIILRNIPYFEETLKYTIGLPNDWNFAFYMPTFLRIYLLFLIIPGLFFVMKHMQKLRAVKLKPKIVIRKSQ